MSDPVALTEPRTLRLKFSDHFAVVWRSPKMLLTYWSLAAALGIVFLGVDAFADECGCTTWRDYPWGFVLTMGGLLTVVFLVLTPFLSHRRVRALLKGEGSVMQLFDRGVSCRLPTAEGITYWPTIKRFMRTDERLFFFVGKCSAFVVPRRDFADPRDFERWADLAEERLAAVDLNG